MDFDRTHQYILIWKIKKKMKKKKKKKNIKRDQEVIYTIKHSA